MNESLTNGFREHADIAENILGLLDGRTWQEREGILSMVNSRHNRDAPYNQPGFGNPVPTAVEEPVEA